VKKVLITLAPFLMLVLGAVFVVMQPWVSSVVSQPPLVKAKRLQAHVQHLSVDLHPRRFDHAAHTKQAAHYIAREFTAAGAQVSEQKIVVSGVEYKNVIARFGSTTGALVVVGAPGADDNASGVAGLLELAYLLGRSEPKQAIELVAYALEEPPFFRTENMGSAWHARSLKAAGREVRLMLSLEMIGFFSDAPGSQHYPVLGMDWVYPRQGNFMALVGQLKNFSLMRQAKALMAGATDLPVYSANAPPQLHGIDFSDHLSYWREGFPALMVTDTSFLRNPHYHQTSDTFETLDYRRMTQVVQAVYAAVLAF
jgi:Zn-dependent M28 family amino/carboxypeptidase